LLTADDVPTGEHFFPNASNQKHTNGSSMERQDQHTDALQTYQSCFHTDSTIDHISKLHHANRNKVQCTRGNNSPNQHLHTFTSVASLTPITCWISFM